MSTCTLPSPAADETASGVDSAGNTGRSNGLSAGAACSGFANAVAATTRDGTSEAEGALAAAEAAASAGGKPLRPVITFAPTVITTTHFYAPQSIEITGLVSGTNRIAGVNVAVGDAEGGPATLSEPAAAWPFTRTWSYTWQAPGGALPDGEAQIAAATAVERPDRGPSVTMEQSLLVDVVPPAPVALTLTAGGKPVQPGSTLRNGPGALTLGWNASSDGSGVGAYVARWSATSAETTTLSTRLIGPDGPLADVYTSSEATRLRVDLAAQDQAGNQRWLEWGSVYVDGPKTPDYIALGPVGADGWMESGCSLLGADPRSVRRSTASNGRAAQRLFASWDREALRLAWTGANWNGMGDLFVYLDTGPGGTRQIFTPYATPENGTTISLPEGLNADHLVWVRSSAEATLLAWNGGWSEVKALDAGEFRFDASRRDGQTDLYLPFELLGLSPASSLGLLALASEEPAEGSSLQLWATLPLANPANSSAVSRWVGLVGADFDFSLWRSYRWPALADGICPAGSRSGGLEVTITADPPGASLSGLGNGLFWLSDPLPLAALPGERDFGVLPALHPPLADGQPVEYTVRYRNPSDRAALGVRLELSTRGQVRLLDTSLELGNIPAGGEGVATFRAVADRGADPLPIAAVKGLVYDAEHPVGGTPLEWIFVAHRVDRGAPENGRVELERHIGAANLRLTGQASDEAGVKEVIVEIQGPNGARTITCPVKQPLEGRWSCNWTPGAALADGSQVKVRVRSTDVFEQQSGWSEAQTVVVDAAPPLVSFNAEESGVRPGGVVGGRSPVLYGAASDTSGVAVVTVCVRGPAQAEECGTADLLPGSDRWVYRMSDLGALDYASRTVTISAVDTVGNRTTEPLVLTGWVDNVGPVLSAAQVAPEVVLGRSAAVLSGSAQDGSETAGAREVEVTVRVQPPAGEAFRADTLRDGRKWRYDLAGAQAGVYTLWVDADDAAGNRSTAGPFEVRVVCADAAVKAVTLTAEPSPEGGRWLTIKTTIRNTGPATIPAGLSFAILGPAAVPTAAGSAEALAAAAPTAAAPAPIGTLTTTVALAAGAQESFAFRWTTSDTGRVTFNVAPASEGVAYAGGMALCDRPEAAAFQVSLQEVTLYDGWNLISPPVEPFDIDVSTVQRSVAGSYRTILGYESGLQTYDAERPARATLRAIHAGHGYWIRAKTGAQPNPPASDEAPAPVAALRLAGESVDENLPLRLAAGWNLVGYLPRASLPVSAALRSIEGNYAALLGFEGTAVSYYPDLDAGYNTLPLLYPSSGYWLDARRAATLQYPSTVTATLPVSGTPTVSETLALSARLGLIRAAEQAAGARPTYRWSNLYGRVYLPDGAPAPAGATVTALAAGVPCGATVVTTAGRFGLLACYGDDETTAAVDGARAGAAITFLVNGLAAPALALRFNGDTAPAGQGPTWTAIGDRWEVELGLPRADEQSPTVVVQPDQRSGQYSDVMSPVDIVVADVAGDALDVSAAWRSATASGPWLPAGLALAGPDCSEAEGRRSCRWRLSGPLDVAAGMYTVTVTAMDRAGLSAEAGLRIVVAAEDADLTLAPANPALVTLPPGSETAAPFTLSVSAGELSPDAGEHTAAGDIRRAEISLTLEPAASGATLQPAACDPPVKEGEGGSARLVLSCRFDGTPLGHYLVRGVAAGSYYAGAVQGAVAVLPQAPPALWLPLIMR